MYVCVCVLFLSLQSSNVGLRSIRTNDMTVLTGNETRMAKEAWSELIVRIDNHMITPHNRKILVRCETNIFNLYRGAAEADLKINDDNLWSHGGKVSPTTDQRSSSSPSNGDPDNSALQAGAVNLFGYRLKIILVLSSILLYAMQFTS